MKKLINLNTLFIIVISSLIVIPILFLRDFTPKNELKYINIAVNMVQNHNFFSMSDNISAYTDKPPFFFWLINIIASVFKNYTLGITGFFLSYIPAAAILILSLLFSIRYISKTRAYFAALMLITTPLFFISASCIRMDMLMTLFITLSLVIFFMIYTNQLKNSIFNSFLIYLFTVAAVYIKGPAGIIVPIFTIILFLAFEKNLHFLKKIYFVQGVIFILLMIFLWFIPSLYFNGSGYISDILKKQLIGRAVNSDVHNRPFYYYLSILPLLYFQWFPFIVSCAVFYFKNKNFVNKYEKFMFIWAGFTFLFFSLVSSKLWIYLMPASFPAAIILTSFINRNIYNNYVKIPLFITAFVNFSAGTAVIVLSHKVISAINVSDFLFSGITFILFSVLSVVLYFKNKILSLYLSTILIFILFTANLTFIVPEYNGLIGLKEGVSKINKTSAPIFAYKFYPGVYGGFYINRHISILNSADSIPAMAVIITRPKYEKEITSQNLKYSYIYKNKNYSIIKIIKQK